MIEAALESEKAVSRGDASAAAVGSGLKGTPGDASVRVARNQASSQPP